VHTVSPAVAQVRRTGCADETVAAFTRFITDGDLAKRAFASLPKHLEGEVHATPSVQSISGQRAHGFCGSSQADHEGVARILCRANYGGDPCIVGVHIPFGPDLAPGTGHIGFFLRCSVETAGSDPPLDPEILHRPLQSARASDARLRGRVYSDRLS